MELLLGLGIMVGIAALWWFAVKLFIWLMFAASSLVPHIGRRHRHGKWDELNNTKRR